MSRKYQMGFGPKLWVKMMGYTCPIQHLVGFKALKPTEMVQLN